MKQTFLIFLCGIAFGCATQDAARMIDRRCPVKRVDGEKADEVVRAELYYDGRYVYIVGNCWRDTRAIARWCDAEGIAYEQEEVAVRRDGKVIPNGHVRLKVNGQSIEYVDGIGIVRKR